jgi:hypothetical protein
LIGIRTYDFNLIFTWCRKTKAAKEEISDEVGEEPSDANDEDFMEGKKKSPKKPRK